jgi:hypothetical protein
MSKIRVHKNGNFTIMSNYHFKEKKMSLKAKGLLSLMLSLPNDWNYSVSGLVTLSKDGKDSVMSALAELELFGYLQRERMTNSKGQFSGIEYNIYEEPQREKPIAEKQNEEKQTAEKPIAAKPTQLNTNSIKELNNKIIDILNTKDTELLELYQEYIKVRENIKAPLSENGLEKLVERAKRLSKNNVRLEKSILETAIINNWKNVYLPREQELEFIKNEGLDELRSFYGIE